jgi:hypothetical protein
VPQCPHPPTHQDRLPLPPQVHAREATVLRKAADAARRRIGELEAENKALQRRAQQAGPNNTTSYRL